MSEGASKPADGLVVYTVGHSNVSSEAFIALLKQHGIAVLVDVRSAPYSRYVPHFNGDALKAAVQTAGIRYLYLGAELGGRPADRGYYDGAGHVLYGLLAQSEEFRAGIERLLLGARDFRVAPMCNEENPAECHRRLLVGRVLVERGVRLMHIRGDGRIETEQELAAAEQPAETGQQEFAFAAHERPEWKSTRPVSQARPLSANSQRLTAHVGGC
jgi:uncharacterized protein (DUF488 family)